MFKLTIINIYKSAILNLQYVWEHFYQKITQPLIFVQLFSEMSYPIDVTQNPIRDGSRSQNPRQSFRDPSEPIYTDPALFERPRSGRAKQPKTGI